jgi:hypothetical protein
MAVGTYRLGTKGFFKTVREDISLSMDGLALGVFILPIQYFLILLRLSASHRMSAMASASKLGLLQPQIA